MLVGNIRVEPVIDGEFSLDAKQWYPNVSEDALAKHPRWFGPGGTFTMTVGGFLVRTGARLALVDCGIGPYLPDEDNGGKFLDDLRSKGVAPEDITDVLFTHLHFDHVGWATQKGTVVFANARYRCDAADWEWFMANEEGARRKLAPIAGRLETWSGSATVLPGIDALPTYGHTPGHAAFAISSGDERAYLLGDAAHCPVELEDIEWDGISDVDPVAARRARDEVARMLEAEGARAAGAHFPGLEFGRLMRLGGEAAWTV
jgi:glyoxylase-like metal-dependent hydrolase (beta-lactamase superfamily II)